MAQVKEKLRELYDKNQVLFLGVTGGFVIGGALLFVHFFFTILLTLVLAAITWVTLLFGVAYLWKKKIPTLVENANNSQERPLSPRFHDLSKDTNENQFTQLEKIIDEILKKLVLVNQNVRFISPISTF